MPEECNAVKRSEQIACFVAVHAGAGYHAVHLERAYNQALKQACSSAVSTTNCSRGVTNAVQSLEACAITNAGVGSNLTLEGKVEEDASIMLGDGTFGAIGAVPGVGSAIEVAAQLASESKQPLSLGRVRPIFLAGDQARLWAASRHLQTASSVEALPKWHVTERALQQWTKYRAMIEADAAGKELHSDATCLQRKSCQPTEQWPDQAAPAGKTKRKASQLDIDISVTAKRRPEGASSSPPDDPDQAANQQAQTVASQTDNSSLLNDTVGAIFVDSAGKVGAGVSSGGLAMKTPGRVGEAAMYACGCWAADADPAANRPAVACSVSGVGEMIVRANLAKACFNQMLDPEQSVDEACGKVIRKTCEQECGPRDCGLIAVRVTQIEDSPCTQIRVEFAAVHCSKSMALAYYQPECMDKPVSYVLRQPSKSSSTPHLTFSGFVCKWDIT